MIVSVMRRIAKWKEQIAPRVKLKDMLSVQMEQFRNLRSWISNLLTVINVKKGNMKIANVMILMYVE